jgi:hypothetical protein
MTNQFDELSKSLAAGMSRRKAARSFLAGLGGAAFAAFTGKTAIAATSASCDAWCAAQAAQFQQLCLSASANCPDGMCASLLPAASGAAKAAYMGGGARYAGLTPIPIPIGINGTPVPIVNGTPVINGTPVVNGTPTPIGKIPVPQVPQYCVVVSPVAVPI